VGKLANRLIDDRALCRHEGGIHRRQRLGGLLNQAGLPRVVFVFTTDGERIVGIDILADTSRLAQMEVDVL
jgi:hypothetical protein